MVNAEHQRTLHGLGGVSATTKLGVRALPMSGGVVDIPKPPQRLCQAEHGLGGLALVERRSEELPGRLPVSGP